jgi:asparagine synthase (glutamine-hydrolysing)
MCGIAGIVSGSGKRVEADRLTGMIEMLDHRGPDDRGCHVEPAVALGHTRLSVVDVAGGRQPLSNEDGSIWITFNGEIFNHRELRTELIDRGHRFRTHSDTEVIVHLYEEVGAAGLAERLNGQWALAIWDARTRTLVASRDRLGVRPFYYTVAGGELIFASEIKALFAHAAVSREIDPRGVDNIFTFWSTLAPRTVFKGISELPPGHVLTWCSGRCEVTRYWSPAFPPVSDASPLDANAAGDDEGLRERLLALLDAATERRLQADVPVGAYVSGGLDSSLVSALAAAHLSRPLATFSISFDDAAFDESRFQGEVVSRLGSEHHDLRCARADIGRVFPDVVWHAEMPMLRTAPAPMYLLAGLVRERGYKVVLTGEGADEMFGGYDLFKESKIRRFWAAQPASRRRAALLKRLDPYLPQLHRQPAASLGAFFHASPDDTSNPLFSHLPRIGLTSRLKMFFSAQMRDAIGDYDGCAELTAGLPADFRQWDPLCQAQYIEATNLLPGYLLSAQADRMAMAHGVEGRYPFLDPDVVAFASRLRPSLKMKALNEKYLLKRAAASVVPAAVVNRAKQPYRAPEAAGMLAEDRTGYFAELLAPEQVRRAGIFDPDAVTRLVHKSRQPKPISVSDDMALTGVLSTQMVIDRFITHFTPLSHGHACHSAS